MVWSKIGVHARINMRTTVGPLCRDSGPLVCSNVSSVFFFVNAGGTFPFSFNCTRGVGLEEASPPMSWLSKV
jgi:hypothetical protein